MKIGEQWRVELLQNFYDTFIVEADGEKFDPPHPTRIDKSDGCSYMDVEIMKIDGEMIQCKTIGCSTNPEEPDSYAIFKIPNDNTTARFYKWFN